ncbi:hypothetical protein BSM4216_3402 [Bacillus smithii]|nr:hypothetical protein BSM4216_3402 [Bacillus smithii]
MSSFNSPGIWEDETIVKKGCLCLFCLSFDPLIFPGGFFCSFKR